jgi:asparagine synthase (glutamine-hydrolysing)
VCGIAGYLVAGSTLDPTVAVTAMTDRIAHRGPDGAGIWADVDAGVALGHRRLSIVGLGDEGAQPMISRSGRWVLTYNGEIYNAPDLAARLGADRSWRGTSDTEVLVEAIDAWGIRATLDRLDGMFAFAAWDRSERVLTLARDRIGEKPLAWAPVAGGVAFASELGALRAFGGVDTTVDREALALFLRFKYVPAPWTIHRGVRKLPPGHLLEIRAGRVGDPEAWWSYDDAVLAGAADRLADETEALEALDATLDAAVRRRLRSDVPIGAFLSGGIDSSIVATHAAAATTGALRTFTIGSDDADHDEADHARAIAERLGAEHTELIVTSADALAAVPTLASRWDEPYADSSQLPTLLVSGLARQHVTVALSGDGGDELFGGYNRHLWLPRTWARVGRVPAPLRRTAARALTAPDPATWDRVARVLPERRRPRLLGLKAEKMASVLGADDPADAYGRLVSHWQDPRLLVPDVVEPRTLTHRHGDWPTGLDLADQIMAVDAQTYLPDDVLVKVDRASMAHGLEARVPLLAPDVIDVAARLAPDLKIRGGTGKWALRELLARHHPRDLFERPKSGFGVPIAAWLRGPLVPWAEDLLDPHALAADGLVAPGPVRAAWDEHRRGTRDRSYELWDVLMLTSWYRAWRS